MSAGGAVLRITAHDLQGTRIMRTIRHPLALALGATLAIALPATSAPPPGPKTQVWIDVDTHQMAGMPDLGGLGRFAGRMGGKQALGYPDARSAAASGLYFDVALHNALAPGQQAQQLVPAGLGLGKALPLLPPTREVNPEGDGTPGIDGSEARMRVYWGCGATIGKGQPRVIEMRLRNGKPEASGTLQSRQAPNRDVRPDPSYALWPNPKARKRAGSGASLQGEHRITGDGVPESLKFTLGEQADFMPAIALQQQGAPADGIVFSWQPVARARAYFLSAIARQGDEVVVWSSAEVPDMGTGLVDFLTAADVDRWVKEKALLAPSTTRCQIPKGILKDGGEAGAGILSMIAYGPETNLTWPPKPADPKQPWTPEWNVRVRTKSTAGAMLGMDLSGMGMSGMGADDGNEASEDAGEAKPEESKGKKLLRGLLGNF